MLPSDPTNSMDGQRFSTSDVDQDAWAGGQCAQQSGWWFSNCGLANPTGLLVLTSNGSRDTSVPSVWWGVGVFDGLAVEAINLKLMGSDLN